MAALLDNVKLVINQGATFTRRFTWQTGAPPAPVDLTGCTARMQVRPSVASADVLLELTTENNRIELDEPNGGITLEVDAATTTGLTKGGKFDLEVVFPTGRVVRLLAGDVELSPEVTRTP